MKANREHKSTVFTTLFSEEEKLLELYNALSGSNYGVETKININTLQDVLFMDIKNDISFTIDDKIIFLVEHQSTISENLPLRMLLYISRVYEKIVDREAAYGTKLVKIPVPELIVLYNGKANFPDEKTLRLSDAFKEVPCNTDKFGSMDLTVRVLNINDGRNEDIVKRSKALREYVIFIKKIREGTDAGKDLSDAVVDAVKYCEENQILQQFLESYASEVLNMLMTEFKIEDAIAVWKKEGIEEGIAKGQLQIAYNLFVRRGKSASKTEVSETLRDLGVSEEVIQEAIKRYESEHA